MPVDYSKWDALELSDDSDIEVHPNVDKRSFIRAKQNQIHQERQQRRHQIETYQYEHVVNEGLMGRISALLAALRSHADEVASQSKNPGEVAFRAVMESSAGLKPEDDHPPPRPAGVHAHSDPPPSYTKMMAMLLDQVNKALDDKGVGGDSADRYAAMLAEVEDHLRKVQDLQGQLVLRLAELQAEEGKKITSEGIHTGFDSSHVTKATPGEAKTAAPQLLNPGYAADTRVGDPAPKKEGGAGGGEDDDDDDDDDESEMEASAEAKQFAHIKTDAYQTSLSFLAAHPQILAEKEQDGLMVMGFDAALQGHDDFSRQCVHQALLLQYCRALGRDGVALFFKRITTPGHKARDVFYKDVQDTSAKIRARAREINAKRRKDEAEGKVSEGVEQIQLHAVEPGTVINITVPPQDSEDAEVQKGRAIFETFAPAMRKALESASLEEVNKALGKMKVEDAEVLVEKLGEAGILSLVEGGVIDATTEEGKAKVKQIEEEAAGATTEEVYGDPE